MTVKIKFLKSVTQDKFLHNLVNAKKKNSEYKHFHHHLFEEAKDKVSFSINDESGKNIVRCGIDFYPNENLVEMECSPCDFGKLQALLVFDLLQDINERAIVRFIDEKIYFDGGMDFYYVTDGPRPKIKKVSSSRDDFLEVTNSRILAEIDALDFI